MNSTENNVFVGTSGYSYAEWKGSFYPPKLPAREYLDFYAREFATTEINNTFYRLPSPDAAEGWASRVGDSFLFSVKLTGRITHQKRLTDVDSEMERFREGIQPLAGKLGCVLVQLPPYFRKDLGLLNDFADRYSTMFPMAFEFRHESWDSDDVRKMLGDKHLALVLAETDDHKPDRKAGLIGPFVYLRLRKTDYHDDELADWGTWVTGVRKPVYIYFKHDQKAPVLARRFLQLLSSGAAVGPTSKSDSN